MDDQIESETKTLGEAEAKPPEHATQKKPLSIAGCVILFLAFIIPVFPLLIFLPGLFGSSGPAAAATGGMLALLYGSVILPGAIIGIVVITLLNIRTHKPSKSGGNAQNQVDATQKTTEKAATEIPKVVKIAGIVTGTLLVILVVVVVWIIILMKT